MCIKTYVKATILSAVLLLGINTPVKATWPVFDGSVLGESVTQVQTTVSEIKTQVESTVKLGDISNAIGDPGAALSKFAGDEAAKQLKKAEKAKKQAEKIKKVKDDINKAKKEYEKKKKQYDEYKDKLEKAKKDYAEAKEMINDAKEVASNAGALANQALSDAQNKVASKTGGVIGSSSSSNQKTVSQTKQTTSNSNIQTKTTNINNSSAVRTGGVNTAVSRNSTVTARSGGQTQAISPKNTIITKAGDFNQPVRTGEATAVKAGGVNQAADVKRTAVSQGDNSNMSAANKAVVGRRPFSRDNATNKDIALDKRELPTKAIENDEALPTENEEDAVVSTEDSVENEDVSEDENSLQNRGKAVADKIKNVAAEQGAMEATNMLKTEVRKAIRENDIKTLDALTKLNKSDIVISDSKKYEEKPIVGRRAFSKPTEVKPTVQNSVTTPVATQAVRQGEIKENATTLPKQLSAPQPLMKNSVSSSPLNAQKEKVNAIKPEISPDKLDLKAAPTMMLQKNSYWEGEENFQNVKMSYAETLRFGDVANDCTDYSYAMQTENDGEIIILSKDLAKKCCIKTEQLKDYNVIQDCMKKFAWEMNGHLNPIKAETEEGAENNEAADASIAQEAKGQHSGIEAQSKKYNSASAAAHLSRAFAYLPDEFIPQLKKTQEQQGEGATVRDSKAALDLTTQHMANLLNLMRDIEATALMTGSFENLGNIKEETLVEGKEIGIPAESGEYEASVTIAEGNYPVLPEVIAQRCQIKVSENTDGLKSCLGQVVKDLYATDNKDVEVAQAFIDVVKYQNNLMSMAKGMEQKVRVAEYDEKMNKLQETNEDATTERDGDAANMDVDAENNAMWTEFNRLMASNIAGTVLNALDTLTPITSTESKG